MRFLPGIKFELAESLRNPHHSGDTAAQRRAQVFISRLLLDDPKNPWQAVKVPQLYSSMVRFQSRMTNDFVSLLSDNAGRV
jgi:hypothetical protein